MFDFFSLPSVGDVQPSVACLNDGWIAVLPWFRFEHGDGLPSLGVARQRQFEGRAATAILIRAIADGVEDQGVPAVNHGDRIDSRIGIRDLQRLEGGPGCASICGFRGKHPTRLRSSQGHEPDVRLQHRGLNSGELIWIGDVR